MAESKKTSTKTPRKSAKTVKTAKKAAPKRNVTNKALRAADQVEAAKVNQKNVTLSVEKPQKAKRTVKAVTLRGIRMLSIFSALLLLIEAIALVVLSAKNNGSMAITTPYLSQDTLASSSVGRNVYSQASEHLFDVNIIYLLALALVAAAAVLLTTALWKRRSYQNSLDARTNKFRALEWAIAGTLSFIVLALVNGINDLPTLVIITVLLVGMSGLGLMMERKNRNNKPVNWTHYWLGSAAGLLPWLIIAIYVIGAAIFGNGLPWYLYVVDGVLLLLSIVAALSTRRYYNRNLGGAEYLRLERSMIVLGLLSKTALAAILFAGFLHK